MKLTRTGAALLLGTGFAVGAIAVPGAASLARQLAVPAAAAQATDQRSLLMLFGRVFDIVRANYVEPVADSKLITNALNGMLTGLDPHSAYMTEQQWHDMQTETDGQFGGIGLEVTDDGGLLEVVSPIDGTPAAQAGVKPGDLITAVNGKTVEGLSLTEAVAQLRGRPNTTLKMTIKRNGVADPLEITLTRQIIHVQTVKSALNGDIGVIRISEFTEQTDPGLHNALANLKRESGGRLRGIVLDLRNDPGGLLDQAIAVSNDFLAHGGIVSTRGRHPSDNQSWSADPRDNIAGTLPVVVLTNNGTASAAEIVAAALQDNRRALVLGTQSFGKGSVQSVMPLAGNGAIRLTTARYYTPSGRSIQGLGVTPNVEVRESSKPQPHFGPQREADLLHILSNQGGTQQVTPPPPADLPAIAATLPKTPPENWPNFNPAKPGTDFQLQQALTLVHAMSPFSQASR